MKQTQKKRNVNTSSTQEQIKEISFVSEFS